METGKKASLEHRRHVVDPTLLGLHEVRTEWAGWWTRDTLLLGQG